MAIEQESRWSVDAEAGKGSVGPSPELLGSLKRRLARLYAERLIGVYVFGSYARGDAEPDSDLDILIVLDRVSDYDAEIERTSRLISSLSLEYDVSLSRVFISQETWHRSPTAFVQNVRAEAIPA